MRITLIFLIVFATAVCYADQREHPDNWKSYYGMAWDDTPENHIRYAKQMGYNSIAIKNAASISDYTSNPDIRGFKFWLIDPHHYNEIRDSRSRSVDENGTHTQVLIDWYEEKMVWKSGTSTFPQNMASGYFFGTSTKYYVEWDWQQQAVIDFVVDGVIAFMKAQHSPSLLFMCQGFLVDVPRLHGEFYRWSGGETATNLTYWTGTDSCANESHTHTYATYSDGKAAYFKALIAALRQEMSNTKWILQPSRIYSSGYTTDEWVYLIKDRADKDELTPDMLSEEDSTTNFVTDSNNFNSGVNITLDRVENTQHKNIDEYRNRLIASNAGVNGAWYNWFGSFMASGYSPDFQSITEVYPRLQLVRCITNWDNLANIPLGNRATVTASYGTETYRATHTTMSGDTLVYSYIGQYGMYSRNWKRPNELFVVKMGTNTELYDPVVIGSGEMIKEIYTTNEYFEPVANVKDTQWTQTGNSWQINAGIVTGNLTDIGVGYIFKVYPQGGYTIN